MPAVYHVRITKEASSHLDEIFTFIGSQSPQNAEQVCERLLDEIFSLKWFPHRYKVHRRGKKQNGEAAVRSMPVPPFVVYYRIIESRRVVRIVSILHGHRRRPRGFK
jgi:plasmid stabilization system protein ParE